MDYATFQSTYVDSAGTFADNTTRQISEADLRQFATDILNSFALSASSNLNAQIFQIGSWNMDADSTKNVYLGASSNVALLKSATYAVFNDSRTSFITFPYNNVVSGNVEGGSDDIQVSGASAIVQLYRTTGGAFDSAAFNDTSINRGYVTLFF